MRILTIALIAMSLILGSCNGESKKNKNNSSSTKVTVAQWGQEKYLIYLPFYIAMEKGFFKEEGLDIEVKYSGNDDQVFATVLKGEAMFGIADPIFTAISREQGSNGIVIASIVDGVPFWGVSKNDNKINSIADFNSKKIGTFPSPSTVYTLMKNMIDDNKDVLKNTDIVQAPIGSQIALLENGNADVVMELEPSASIAESKGYHIVYSASNLSGSFAFTGVTTTEGNAENNKETVQKFVNAIQKAIDFIHSDLNSTISIAQLLFPDIDKTVVTNAVTRMVQDGTIPQNAGISSESWENAVKIRHQIGDIKNIKQTEKAVDNSFAENYKK